MGNVPFFFHVTRPPLGSTDSEADAAFRRSEAETEVEASNSSSSAVTQECLPDLVMVPYFAGTWRRGEERVVRRGRREDERLPLRGEEAQRREQSRGR
jgi:hypothetical protein